MATTAQPAVLHGRAQHVEMAGRRVLSRKWLMRILTVAGVLLGAVVGVLYARTVSWSVEWLVLVVGGIGGAVLGYLAIAVPQITLHYLKREWYRTVANHWRAVVRQAAGRARRKAEPSLPEPEALTTTGIAHLLLGSHQAALTRLREAASHHDPDTAPDLQRFNALAAAEAAHGDWQKAADALVRVIEAYPEDETALANLAALVAAMPAAAQLPHTLAKILRDVGPRVLNNLAVRHLRAGETEAAIPLLRRAIAGDPTNPYVGANLGVLAFQTGDYRSALENLATAIQFAPAEAAILSALGATMAMQGAYPAAETALSKAEHLDARMSSAKVNLGALRLSQGRHEEAHAALHAVPHGDRNEAAARHNEALAWARSGDWQQAREPAERAVELRPDVADYRATLGAVCWEAGDYQAADQHFQAAVKASGSSSPAVVNAARAALAVGRTEEAMALLEGLGESGAGNAEVQFDLGVTHLMMAVQRFKPQMNRTEQALFRASVKASIQAFEQCREHRRTQTSEAEFNIGLAHYLGAEYEAAADGFSRAAQIGHDASAHLCAGTAFAEAAARIQHERAHDGGELIGQAAQLYKQAHTHLDQAGNHSADSAAVFNNLGVVCYELGRVEDAMKAFKRLVQLEDTAESCNTLGLAYAKQGQILYRAWQMKRNTEGEKVDRTQLDEGRKLLGSAIHYFKQAIRHDPDSAVLHSNIGLAYMLRNSRGDMEQALWHWKLMRDTGGEWAERQFAAMAQVLDASQAAKATFHDIDRAIRPLSVPKAVRMLDPVPGPPTYVAEPVMDVGQWELTADNRDLKTALRARARLYSLEKQLKRLAI